MSETVSNLQAVGLARGVVMHLYRVDGERTRTLCDRRIGINPRYLGEGGHYASPSSAATCQRCVKLAAA